MSDQPKSNLSLESNSQSIEGDIPVTGPQAVNAAAADNDNNDNDHPKTIRKKLMMRLKLVGLTKFYNMIKLSFN